jgi:uncharacterized protein (TIGR00251 family)
VLPPSWLRAHPDGTVIQLRVAPRASRSAIVGPHGGALRVRVAAAPADGAANRELLALLAAVLGVRASDVELESGARGRDKRVRVRGLVPEQVLARIR